MTASLAVIGAKPSEASSDTRCGDSDSASLVAGLILAGGASRRMKAPKAALRAHGATFVAHVAHALAAGGTSPNLVVAGVHRETTRAALGSAYNFPLLDNPAPERGPISSIAIGLAWLRSDPRVRGCIIAPVDHPAITAGTVAALLEAACATTHPIVVPVFRGRRGHPTYFAREVWHELLDPQLDGGARVVVQRAPARVREVKVIDPGIVRNIDTPEDLAAWRAMQEPGSIQ